MKMIKVTVDDAIEALLPRVVLRVVATDLKGSEYRVVVDNPRGHPDNPMDDSDIGKKFLSLADPVVGSERSARLLERSWGVFEESDIGSLLRAFDLNAAARAA
jgi:2-methylcitrate dehydratase PrpD